MLHKASGKQNKEPIFLETQEILNKANVTEVYITLSVSFPPVP